MKIKGKVNVNGRLIEYEFEGSSDDLEYLESMGAKLLNSFFDKTAK